MHTKFGESRLLPLHPSTVDALGCYAQAREHAADPAQEAFFLSPTGRRVGSQQAAGTLHRLADRSGIETPERRRPPRLYDFRHSFAVNTLLDWHRQGVDVWERLPVLSAYLGHLRPANTYWYLEAAPELMALVADRLAQAWTQRP
jgi:integrase/recombinase XerD